MVKNFSVVPARLSKTIFTKHVNLLLIQNKYFNEDDVANVQEDIKYYYVWIKDLSRLVSRQLNTHKHKKYICHRCLNYFSTEIKLNEHLIDCAKINNCKISFSKEAKMYFKNFSHKEVLPFIIYANFEAAAFG